MTFEEWLAAARAHPFWETIPYARDQYASAAGRKYTSNDYILTPDELEYRSRLRAQDPEAADLYAAWISGHLHEAHIACLDDYADALAAAAAADGGTVLRVYCASCGRKARSIGEVRKTSRGLVFHAVRPYRDVTKIVVADAPPGSSVPDATTEVYALLDQPSPDPSRWSPQVHCKRHGPAMIDRADLLRAVTGPTRRYLAQCIAPHVSAVR